MALSSVKSLSALLRGITSNHNGDFYCLNCFRLYSTKEKLKKHEKKQKVCYIWKKEFSTDKNDKNVFKLYHKVRDHCHYIGKCRGAAHSIYNLRYKTPKEIPVVSHNGSTYDYHFIIKRLRKNLMVSLDA